EAKKRADEEARQAALAEQQRKADEAKQAAEAKKRARQEAKAAALAEKQRKADEAKEATEAKKRAQEEARQAALAEKQRKADEKRRARQEAAAERTSPPEQGEAPAPTPSAGTPVSVSGRRKTMTFLGFKQEAGSSKIYVRTTEPVRYSVSGGANRTVVL